MQGKNEIQAQIFTEALQRIEKQINEKLKGNQELLKLLASLNENKEFIESILDISKNNEQLIHLAFTGKEIVDELEQKTKEQSRNVAALLIAEFNKSRGYYLAFLLREQENKATTPSSNPSQFMNHFGAREDIKAIQVYNDYKSSPHIFFQSAVTYGTGSAAYVTSSGTPNPSSPIAAPTNEVFSKPYGSTFSKEEKINELPTVAMSNKEIQTSVPYDLARNELAETLKEKIKTGGNPDPTYKYLLDKLLDPAIKDNPDVKEIIKSEMKAIREGVVNPNLKEYLAWCDKNHGNIPLNAKFDLSTIETYIRDKNEREKSKESNFPHSICP